MLVLRLALAVALVTLAQAYRLPPTDQKIGDAKLAAQAPLRLVAKAPSESELSAFVAALRLGPAAHQADPTAKFHAGLEEVTKWSHEAALRAHLLHKAKLEARARAAAKAKPSRAEIYRQGARYVMDKIFRLPGAPIPINFSRP